MAWIDLRGHIHFRFCSRRQAHQKKRVGLFPFLLTCSENNSNSPFCLLFFSSFGTNHILFKKKKKMPHLSKNRQSTCSLWKRSRPDTTSVSSS
jgi:hypothetical protein